jgi:hypothetical protein
MLYRTFEGRPPLWLPIAFSLVVFSPAQQENWLWGWQIQFFMTILGTVAAVWSLQRWPGRLEGLFAAIAATVLATFSLSSGLFTWVAVIPVLLMQKPLKWNRIAIWAGAAAVTIGLYLHNYFKPPEHPPLTKFLEAPWEFVQYVLMYLGSPLAFDSTKAALRLGAAELAFCVAMLILAVRHRRSELTVLMPWLALGAQAIMLALATGIGRVGFSARQALSGRYITISSLLLLAALVVFARWLSVCPAKTRRSRAILFAIACTVLAAFGYLYARSFARGVQLMEERRQIMAVCLTQLKDYPNTSEEVLGQLYPRHRMDITRQRIEILRRLGIILPPAPEASQPDKRPEH